jgi:hypothetical protein
MDNRKGLLMREGSPRSVVLLRTASAVLCAWFALVALFPIRSAAVVDSYSPANTNAPTDGAPWDHVGTVNAASGIYIGNGWVVSAAHVGWGDFNLSGTTYAFDGTSLRLTNADGSATDMVMFHLNPPPKLGSLILATNTPAAYSQVDMMGYGRIAGSTQTNIGSFRGFYWSSWGYKSWGNNKINPNAVFVINAGFGNISVFETDFTAPGTTGSASPTSNETEAASGDSGGGVFYLLGSRWELAGMIDAIGVQPNQPANTAAYGDVTYLADIATYRPQIAAWRASTSPALSLWPSGSSLRLSWAETGVAYDLQSASSMSSPVWSMVASNPPPTNGLITVTVPISGPARLFRLHLTGSQ